MTILPVLSTATPEMRTIGAVSVDCRYTESTVRKPAVNAGALVGRLDVLASLCFSAHPDKAIRASTIPDERANETIVACTPEPSGGTFMP